MANTPYISLILPAYNESLRIAQTVTEAVTYFQQQGLSYQIIVSADGTDNTREIVQHMAATNPALQVIGKTKRGGKGLALRQAMPLAEGQFIGFSDADNKTPVEEFSKIRPFLDEGYDLVIGSRAMRESRIENPQPFYRQLGSKAFAFIMHTMIGLQEIADTQCGFKFFKSAVAKDLFARQQIDGYMYDVEILYIAQQSHYRIKQVPIRWRDDGDSRYNILSGSLRNIKELLKIRLNAFRNVYKVGHSLPLVQ